MFFHLLPLHALQIFAYEDTVLSYNKEQTPKERKKPKSIISHVQYNF